MLGPKNEVGLITSYVKTTRCTYVLQQQKPDCTGVVRLELITSVLTYTLFYVIPDTIVAVSHCIVFICDIQQEKFTSVVRANLGTIFTLLSTLALCYRITSNKVHVRV
uniref:Uncharacterized protein n=1 Tax=Cacopsylla melanoneura TaxID=428564 RepID=A0A8D9DYA4_9HEMI